MKATPIDIPIITLSGSSRVVGCDVFKDSKVPRSGLIKKNKEQDVKIISDAAYYEQARENNNNYY